MLCAYIKKESKIKLYFLFLLFLGLVGVKSIHRGQTRGWDLLPYLCVFVYHPCLVLLIKIVLKVGMV